MSILTDTDHDLLDRYLTRVLELHAQGALSTEDAVADLAHVVGGVDTENGGIVDHMREVLKGAWMSDDA